MSIYPPIQLLIRVLFPAQELGSQLTKFGLRGSENLTYIASTGGWKMEFRRRVWEYEDLQLVDHIENVRTV